MKLPIGIHSGSSDVQTMWDQIRKWSERQIDGHNISDQLLGTGLEFSDEDTTIQVENRPARQIQVAIGDIVQAWDQQLDQLSTGSTLTQNVLPKANATSGLQDSAVSDDGTVVFASRSSIVIGVAQDTQITSSAAGVAKISDYTGGTAASLVFGAATTSRTRLDCSSTTLQTRLGDSSAYAVHAMKQTDLYGGSTTKRVRFDPGTPTVDSTVTVPKDRNGTVVLAPSALTPSTTVPRADANGDLVASGFSDDGSILYMGRDTVSCNKTATIRNAEGGGSKLTVRGADATSNTPGNLELRAGDVTGAINGGIVTMRAGTSSGATSGYTDIQHSDGSTRIQIDTAGNIVLNGAQGTAGYLAVFDSIGAPATSTVQDNGATVSTTSGLTVTGAVDIKTDATLGNTKLNYTSQTASNGGNYNVAATVATVYVDASGLSGTNNYDVTLPSAVTYAGRLVLVKITTVGTGSSTVTVKSSAGTVEGVAAGTGVPMDGTARSRIMYQSDGTNWWKVSP